MELSDFHAEGTEVQGGLVVRAVTGHGVIAWVRDGEPPVMVPFMQLTVVDRATGETDTVDMMVPAHVVGDFMGAIVCAFNTSLNPDADDHSCN